jgi:hypothetical protein
MRQLMLDGELRGRMGAAAHAVSQRYTPRSIVPLWDAILVTPCPAKSATKSYS